MYANGSVLRVFWRSDQRVHRISAPDLGIHVIEHGGQLRKGFIREVFDRAQRMIQRNAAFHINEREHAHLLILPPTHSHHLFVGVLERYPVNPLDRNSRTVPEWAFSRTC